MTTPTTTRSPRDQLALDLRDQISKVGITDTSEKVLKVALLAGCTKRVIVGEPTYKIVDWLNTQCRKSGTDLHHVYVEVYEMVSKVPL